MVNMHLYVCDHRDLSNFAELKLYSFSSVFMILAYFQGHRGIEKVNLACSVLPPENHMRLNTLWLLKKPRTRYHTE